ARDLVGHLAQQERARGLEPAVQVQRRDERLAAVGEQRLLAPPSRLLLAPSEQQVVAEPDAGRERGERRRRDQRRLGLGLLALGEVRELVIEQVRDQEAEHRVPEELQRLVVEHAAGGVLVRARLVREGV